MRCQMHGKGHELAAIKNGIAGRIDAGQPAAAHYHAALDETGCDYFVRYRPLPPNLRYAARTQHESLAAIRHLRRRREGARRGIWSGRTGENQSSRAVAAARRLEDARRGQLATATGKSSRNPAS